MENNEEKKIIPKYEFAKEDGAEFIPPVKRKINKTMEITESFTYYDALQYSMKLEKAIADKEAEIEGLKSMLKAYKEEIELIEKELSVTQIEEAFQLALHEKLKAENSLKEAEKLVNDIVHEDENKKE